MGVGVCMSACLFRCWVGEGGTWVGFVVLLELFVFWGWDFVWKKCIAYLVPLVLYGGYIFGLALCNCCWLSTSLSRYYATSIFTYKDDVFQGPSTFTWVHLFNIFSVMILNMHHVHDCNSVFESEKRVVVSIVLLSPTSLKYRVN